LGNDDIKKMYTTLSGKNSPKITMEKPITPEKLIRAIAEILDVDLEASVSVPTPIAEISNLLRGADPVILEQVRQLLGKK